MTTKETFLSTLRDDQLGFFYAHEYDSNLEDLLHDELTVNQFTLFKQWKKDEDSKLLVGNELITSSPSNPNDPIVLQTIVALLEKLSTRLDRIEEKLENTSGNNIEQLVTNLRILNDKVNEIERNQMLTYTWQKNPDYFASAPINLSEQSAAASTEKRKPTETSIEDYRANSTSLKVNFVSTARKPSEEVSPGGVIFCAGGRDKLCNPSRGVQVYDSKNDKWTNLCEMNAGRGDMALVGAYGRLYAIGGYGKGDNGKISSLASSEVFIPSSGKWQTISPMNIPTQSFGAAHVNGSIYAIGGLNGMICSNKAEKYDVALNQSTQLPKMSVPRVGVGCAVLGGLVYAVGGNFGRNYESSCERYNPQLNKWEGIAEMTQKRSNVGVCALGGFLYAVGGFNDENDALASVERYNRSIDTWSQVADMNIPRSGAAVAVMDGLLYAIGGHNGKKKLYSVEVYSPILDEWSFVADLNETCQGAAAAWVDCSIDVILSEQKTGTFW